MIIKKSSLVWIALSIFWVFGVLVFFEIAGIKLFTDLKWAIKVVYFTFVSSLFLPIVLYYFLSNSDDNHNKLKFAAFSPFVFTVIIIIQHIWYRIR
jgi:hypothetical protein